MRENRWKIRQELPWIILVAASEGFFTFVLWLTAPDAFGSVAVMAAIFAVLVIASGCIIGKKRQERQMDALQACREELEEAARNCQAQEMQVYQEYIEAWTHEVKTPLSLATLVLDNHREEMSPYVYDRTLHKFSGIPHTFHLHPALSPVVSLHPRTTLCFHLHQQYRIRIHLP